MGSELSLRRDAQSQERSSVTKIHRDPVLLESFDNSREGSQKFDFLLLAGASLVTV
jgi:hypothetical protein